jgi:protein SCO1
MRNVLGIVMFGLAIFVFIAGCNPLAEDADVEAVDHSQHQGMDMPATPTLNDMSLYQLESVWSTQGGQDVTLASLMGRIRIVAMTYTSCEVACPRIVASMKKIKKKVDSDRVGYVLVSIDPERDTPAKLNVYASKMDLDGTDWTLLTSNSDNVLELAALLGVRYKVMPDGEYAHSNIISVLDESGALIYQQNGLGPDLTENTIEFVASVLN